MSAEAVIILLVALLAAGTLLAGRAGIRSIQQARKVVFYRTRRTYMLAGWQWLVLALVLFSSTVASALFGEAAANQIFPPTLTPTLVPTETPLPTTTFTLVPTATKTHTVTLMPNGTVTPSSTVTQAPSETRTATLTLTPFPTRTSTSTPTATHTRLP